MALQKILPDTDIDDVSINSLRINVSDIYDKREGILMQLVTSGGNLFGNEADEFNDAKDAYSLLMSDIEKHLDGAV